MGKKCMRQYFDIESSEKLIRLIKKKQLTSKGRCSFATVKPNSALKVKFLKVISMQCSTHISYHLNKLKQLIGRDVALDISKSWRL